MTRPLAPLLMALLWTTASACTGETPPVSDQAASGGAGADTSGCALVEEGFGPPGTVAVRAETVVSGLEIPWGIAFLPGGDMLVTERPGRVRLVRDGRLVPEPVASVPISQGGEGGLLGIAVHPDFASNRYFYLYYTAESSSGTINRVERWLLADDGLSAAADRIVLDGIPAASFHNGGRIRFGPDGMLYVGTGDSRDPDLARDSTSMAGKLLRVTPEGQAPADNPFPGSPVYLTGVRNTQGFDWPGGATIWLSDHGPSGELGRSGHDEVSVAQPGDDLGWPTIYGCEAQAGLASPLLSWAEAAPPGGAAIYTGSRIPEWQGSLLIGTLGSRHLHRAVIGEGGTLTRHEVYFHGDPPEGYGRLREVVMGPDGELYVTTSNCDGRGDCPPEKDSILRIVPR